MRERIGNLLANRIDRLPQISLYFSTKGDFYLFILFFKGVFILCRRETEGL